MSDASRFTTQKDQSFRTFLGELERRGELIRFLKPVDPLRNMSAVEWKTYNELGKSSLFTAIEGYPGWTACSQIVADRRKWSIGLGIDEQDFLQQISTRVRLGGSQKVLAVAALSDGTFWSASAEVVVTLSACYDAT